MPHPTLEALYRPISDYYKSRFGQKVYKVPVTLAETCPNREGLKGMQLCVFCDEWGSAAREQMFGTPLEEQIKFVSQVQKSKKKSSAYLVYFQAYTNSFLRVQKLNEAFDLALQQPGVVGLIVGTRPDCISKTLLELWQSYNQKSFLAVEFGVQSFFDHHLAFLRRGHTSSQSISAILKTSAQAQIDVGIHLMFGLPEETDLEIIETARICSELPIRSVKLHHLHVLKNTPLEQIYQKGNFKPIDRETYAHRVGLFLDHLSKRIFVDRLAAYSSRYDQLIAPEWTKRKMETHQFILDQMRNNGYVQGRQFQEHHHDSELRRQHDSI